MFIKISHNRLKNCQNVAKMLFGTPKIRGFSGFLFHFSKIIFERDLFDSFNGEAFAASGRDATRLGSRKKLKARKRLEKRADSHQSSAPPENEDRPLSGKKLVRNGSILRSGRHISRTQQWRRAFVAVPRCTLASDHNDPSIGGGRLGAMTPFRKLYNLSDRVCPRQMTIAQRRRFRKMVRRFFGVNSLADFSLQLL